MTPGIAGSPACEKAERCGIMLLKGTSGVNVKRLYRTAALVFLLLSICATGFAQADNRIHIGDDVVVEAGEQVESAVSIGGDIRVYGWVRDSVVSVGGSIYLGPRAKVGGNVTAVGGMVVKQEGAHVSGSISTIDTARITSYFRDFAPSRWDEGDDMPFMTGLFPFLGFLALALIIVALIPDRVDYISSVIKNSAGISLLWGVIGVLLIFPVALVLIISLVGIILIPLELLVVAIAFFLGYVAVVRLIGEKIFAAVKKPGAPMVFETIVGSIALWAAGFVPYVGWLVMTTASVIGFGGFIASLIHRRRGSRTRGGSATAGEGPAQG